MRVSFKKSFEKSFKNRPKAESSSALEAIDSFLKVVETGGKPPAGLGLTQLGGNYWEIRSSLGLRILFSWANDSISFYFQGNHDDIRRFLKRH